jgi:hypothetical protein
VSAYGRSSGAAHEMFIPGVGSFFFDERATGAVTVVPAGGTDEELIQDAFRRMVVPMALQVRGVEVLHASGVRRTGGVTALCGVSGSGKSTLAYGLAAREGELWADDVVAFSAASADVSVLPLPFRVRLLPDAAGALLGMRMDGTGKRPLGEVRTPAGPAPLANVFVLERATVPEIRRIRPATRAFPELLEHAYTFDTAQPGRIERTTTAYARVVGRVPIRRISVPPGLTTLEPLLDGIEAAIVSGADDR